LRKWRETGTLLAPERTGGKLMSWFGSERHVKEAVEHAIRIAKRRPLPATARSLTRPELIDQHRNVIGAASILMFLLFLVATVYLLRSGGGVFPTAVMLVLLVAALVLFVAGRARMQRGQEYRDPQIRIAAGGDRVTFTKQAETRQVDWLSLEAEVSYVVGSKGHVTFLGLKLESPFGRIALEDSWYRNGRNLAAAMLLGKIRAEEARERDKVGIRPTE
jgi:hypothetical protein